MSLLKRIIRAQAKEHQKSMWLKTLRGEALFIRGKFHLTKLGRMKLTEGSK